MCKSKRIKSEQTTLAKIQLGEKGGKTRGKTRANDATEFSGCHRMTLKGFAWANLEYARRYGNAEYGILKL